jgi:hypothetical protein
MWFCCTKLLVRFVSVESGRPPVVANLLNAAVASDDRPTTAALELLVGHPGEKWEVLKADVQDRCVTKFADIEFAWLDLLWTLDTYRKAGVPPYNMGNADIAGGDRLAAIYRGKGNWFATIVALLLENRTAHKLAPRVNVRGFSQNHQIDVAWPDRGTDLLEDPLVCLETKVTGAPTSGGTKARGAMADWTNRRKELKFAATDLKLYRRQQETEIRSWDYWRQHEPPKCYFVWGARLRPQDQVSRMVREVQYLVKTYLDGAGIIAWREKADGSGYETVTVPQEDRVSSVDEILHYIESEIISIAKPGAPIPPPVRPSNALIDTKVLLADRASDD